MDQERTKLDYSLVIEATNDPHFFCFYSPHIEGFTGVGRSVEDCLKKAQVGIAEYLEIIREKGFPIPAKPTHPRIITKGIKDSKQTQRTELHVIPTAGGDWQVLKVPAKRNIRFSTQREAVHHARQLAATVTYNNEIVVIHKKDNKSILKSNSKSKR